MIASDIYLFKIKVTLIFTNHIDSFLYLKVVESFIGVRNFAKFRLKTHPYKYSHGALSYRAGSRFKDNLNGIPGPGSYSPTVGVQSSIEKLKGGRWGHEPKKDMTIRSSLGTLSLNFAFKSVLTSILTSFNEVIKYRIVNAGI